MLHIIMGIIMGLISWGGVALPLGSHEIRIPKQKMPRFFHHQKLPTCRRPASSTSSKASGMATLDVEAEEKRMLEIRGSEGVHIFDRYPPGN